MSKPSNSNENVKVDSLSKTDATLESSPNEDESVESSTNEPEPEGEKEITALDVVEKVINPEEPEEKEKSEDADKTDINKTDETKEADEAKKPEKTDEDIEKEKDEALPFHKNPRFQEIVKEKNAFKAERDALKTEVESYKVPLERLENIDAYLEANNIKSEEASSALEIIALINTGKYAEALKLLTPVMGQLDSLAGNTLPDDLAEKVDSGNIDEDTAIEMAQTRANLEASKVNAQRFQDQASKRDAATVTENSKIFTYSVYLHLESLKKSDPDFEKKEGLIQDRVRAIVATKGSPANVEGAIKIVNEAHTYISSILSEALPKKQASGVSPKNVRTETAQTPPKTAREALERAL